MTFLNIITYKIFKKRYLFVNQERHPAIAKSYLNLGKLYAIEGDFEKSLAHFQMALQQLDLNFNSKDFDDNPNPKKSNAKLVLLEVLKEKMETLVKAHQHTKDLAYLKNAHQASKVIVQTLDELRPEFDTKLDKQFLVTQTYPALQKTVAVSYALFKATQGQEYIEDAFYFIEKSKSILLLEAQRSSEATAYGDVPKSVIEQAYAFKTKMIRIEKEIFKSKIGHGALLDSLYSLKQKYKNWQLSVEKKYPKYYDLKYNSAVVDLKITKKKLKINQALINYMVVKDKIYVVLIDRDGYHLEELPFSEKSKNTVEQLYRKSSKLDINDSSIYRNSYQVYTSVLKSILRTTTATDLIIIPDDILNYIPFDALCTDETKKSYLLYSHVISYASSATLWQGNAPKRSVNKNTLLVFAPEFTGNNSQDALSRAKLSPLKYNQLEANQIAKQFSSTIFKGHNATIANFKKQVNKYSMLHFATHAAANDAFPDYSYLAFSGNNSPSNLMYVKDIYNLNLHADLVTLSACQTGIGKLQKGEGMLSLARAFQYAGASAMVTSLWKINDQSTSEIMTFFYEHLKNGQNKKEALNLAKRRYLEATEDPLLHHPYFWSGIILTGNTAPINNGNTLFYWGIVVSILLLLFVFIYLKKRKLTRNTRF